MIFEKHMRYLSRRYSFIPLSILTNAIYTNDWHEIPLYPIVVTFDDGWKENAALLNIIVKHKICPTIYLTSHIINTRKKFWWTICKPEKREKLKKCINSDRLRILFDEYSYFPEKEYEETRQALDLNEINNLKEYVEYGLHTSYHPVLIRCSIQEKIIEFSEGKSLLEKILEQSIDSFAYPNGDYDEEIIELLKNYGIRNARTIDVGWNNRTTDPYKLKIVGVSDKGSINKFASELTGISLYLQHLLRGSLIGKKK